ncbi:MAG TPA: CBS domain-containing protein, partial [Alphaproteobacteria bacterium]|nr:CBS domain-containing protein [Alphaproteobacteria bacterium]
RDWWLTLLAEGEELSPEFLAHMRAREQTAGEIMSAPVVTVSEETEAVEIARLLAAYRIKRVPVVRQGRIVGIVSRADLIRALAAEEGPAPAPPRGVKHLLGLLADIDEHYLHARDTAAAARPAALSGGAPAVGVSADDFRGLVDDSKHRVVLRRVAEHRVAAEERRKQVKQLIDRHVADAKWQAILHQAREAAERGDKEFMLLRFPHELCSDGGRAINAPEPDWPRTLRGEAAEIYLRWERELKPQGFHLAARVLEFPGGFPGDVGLFLVWGE